MYTKYELIPKSKSFLMGLIEKKRQRNRVKNRYQKQYHFIQDGLRNRVLAIIPGLVITADFMADDLRPGFGDYSPSYV